VLNYRRYEDVRGVYFIDGGDCELHAPACLPPGKESRYPLYRRPGRLRQSGPCEKEKDGCSRRESNPDSIVAQSMARHTSLKILQLCTF
jgi:hypothetical protein